MATTAYLSSDMERAGLDDFETTYREDENGESERGEARVGRHTIRSWIIRSATGKFRHYRVEVGEYLDGRFLPIGPSLRGYLSKGKIRLRVEGQFFGSEEGREAWLLGFALANEIASRIEREQ